MIMTGFNSIEKLPVRILVILGVCLLLVSVSSVPALAQSGNNSSVDLCTSASSTASTIQTIFLIMSILGPIFATLFFAGMLVADSATTKEKYQDERRKVLLYGFGTPVAIAFLEAVADVALLPDQNISCFFP